MNRKIFFDKPTPKVDIEKLPNGAIFLVDDEPYMRISEIKDSRGAKVNSVHLRSGYFKFWENKDVEENDYLFEYFPKHQNIKIVGD